ncbi:MAG: hypothetical protein JNG90_04035 [Planctomycetaceae bacterium]|nr:hypothetical protein [Planctomycetaceae bacterium]
MISCIGWRPSYACCSELPLELDGVWEAPAALGRALSASHNVSGLGPAAANASLLLTSEPNFYILGAKSYGRHPGFLFAAGLQQIRALFSIIGERADLDLYATAPQRVD